MIQALLNSICDIFVYTSTNYFRFTIFSFLIFWVILGQKIAHWRIQPRPKTKAKVIFREIGCSRSTFVVIGVINGFLDTVIFGDRSCLFYEKRYHNIDTYG